MKDPIFMLEPQLIAPRIFEGCDYGCNGKVLARGPKIYQGRWLVWRSGSSFQSARRLAYAQSYLAIQNVDDHRRSPKRMHEGGRLSRALIARYVLEIDAEFGEGTAAHIDLKQTLVVG